MALRQSRPSITFAKDPFWDPCSSQTHCTPHMLRMLRPLAAFKTTQAQGAPKGRQQKGETGPETHIFADFCRFSLIFGSLCNLGVADLRRKPQETADFRRKPQTFAETGFSHLLSPFWRAPTSPNLSKLCSEDCFSRGKIVYLQLERFCLQLSFSAYSPCKCLLDAFSHCR